MSTTPLRRPALPATAEAIACRNPTWSRETCASIAKMQATMAAFDALEATDRLAQLDARNTVRQAARSAL